MTEQLPKTLRSVVIAQLRAEGFTVQAPLVEPVEAPPTPAERLADYIFEHSSRLEYDFVETRALLVENPELYAEAFALLELEPMFRAWPPTLVEKRANSSAPWQIAPAGHYQKTLNAAMDAAFKYHFGETEVPESNEGRL